MFLRGPQVFGLTILFVFASVAAEQNDEWFAAARKGDVSALRALLLKGVDVNAVWRYETTALLMASFRGHTEAVRFLADHGADVNRKDTFYGMTPLTSAAGEGRSEIVEILLAKGARDREPALLMAAGGGKLAVVEALLAGGAPAPEALSKALAGAQAQKHTDVADRLRKAGAVEAKGALVDPATLQRYAGTYRTSTGEESQCAVKEASLYCGARGPTDLLTALSATDFQLAAVPEIKISFQVEDGKVNGATMTTRSGEKVFHRRIQ